MMTDQDFHNIGIPQFGPGKGDGPDTKDDFGRERVTKSAGDRYKFRTPTLVGVALTAPYGHDGAYLTLEAIVRHHLDPAGALASYKEDHGTLEKVYAATLRDTTPLLTTLDTIVQKKVALAERDVSDLLAFLNAQTDASANDSTNETIPRHVPSGIPLDR
jgi:cytochrome c peroxidase